MESFRPRLILFDIDGTLLKGGRSSAPVGSASLWRASTARPETSTGTVSPARQIHRSLLS